jgi:lysylphosphatidylglycerol synthetase-like protein (DUF2156 family)
MTGYYDYVLALIPAALIGVTALLTLVGLSVMTALPAGAAAAAVVMVHAVFVRAPVSDGVREDATRSDRRQGGPGGRSSV